MGHGGYPDDFFKFKIEEIERESTQRAFPAACIFVERPASRMFPNCFDDTFDFGLKSESQTATT